MSLRIATLTVNPAVDVCTAAEHVEPHRKLRCASPRRDPGGGGLNAARVIRRLGGKPIAVFAAGGVNGRRLCELVRTEGLACRIVPIAGDTREDFTVTEERSGDQYRFVMPGPRVTAAEATRLELAVSGLDPKPDIVLASGSLSPGVPVAFYGRLARQVRAAGGKLALDAAGRALRHGLAAGVWLAKPNLNELEELMQAPLATTALQLAACRVLVARGEAEVVALSLGRDGAILVSTSEAWRAPALSVTAASAIGAGDSFMGAFVWAFADGGSLVAAFRWAMAAGAAALMAPGTQLCRATDARRLVRLVRVEPL